MNMLSSGSQLKTLATDGTGPAGPGLVIEELDTMADHMVALSTFCIMADTAVPVAPRGAGRLEA
ncbi:hypothetical protein [Streptomyces sp. NPDC047046]|uniref:hypothetical protein n=1 Tax=unclassified Streptomyces TaxID=2593676 RepID=UPI0033F6600C